MSARRTLPTTWRLAVVSSVLSAGYGVLFTLVGDWRDAYGISEADIGSIIGAGFLSAFVAQILIAPAADRGHARALILLGVVANVAGLVLMAYGTTFAVLMTGRLISGLGIGAAVPAVRRIVIVADPDNLGENLGRLLSADVFGFALGPAISAALIGPFGLAAPFLVVAAASALSIPVVATVRVDEPAAPAHSGLALDLIGNRVVTGAIMLGSAVFLMIGAFDALWDVVHEDLGTADWLANLGITLFALPIVVLGPTSGRLSQRIGPFRVGTVGILLGAAFMFTYGRLPTGGWIFTVGLVHAVCDGLTVAASGVAVSMAVPEERQAGAQGLMGAAQAVVAGVTAAVIGAIYGGPGRAVAYATASAGMLALTAVAVVLAWPFIRDRSLSLRREPATGLGYEGLDAAGSSRTSGISRSVLD